MLSAEQLTKLAAALGGLPVLGCRPGSPAALAGIRYGDIVLAVNGIVTPDWGTYVSARQARAGGMTVTIFRGGNELVLELVYDGAPADPQDWLDYLAGGSGKDDPSPSSGTA